MPSDGDAIRGQKKSAVSEHDRRKHGVTSAHFALLSNGRCRRFHPRPRDLRPPSVRHVPRGDVGRSRSKSRTWGRFLGTMLPVGGGGVKPGQGRPGQGGECRIGVATQGPASGWGQVRMAGCFSIPESARLSQADCLEVHMLLEDHGTSSFRDNPLDSRCISDPGAGNMSNRSSIKNGRAHYG